MKGRCKTTDGYWRVKEPSHPMAAADGWVLEHRKVMYDLGFLTDRSQHVHHKNHDRLDNRPENLEVMTATDHGATHHDIDRDECVRLYVDEGLSMPKVAERLGTDHGNVSRILAGRGVKVRSFADYQPANRNRAEIVRLLNEGWTAPAVGRRFGITAGPIYRVMREEGIPARRRGRPGHQYLTDKSGFGDPPGRDAVT